MQHIAIDLGGRESQICVRTPEGTILQETRWKTRHLGRYLKDQPHSRVILETCTESFHVADQARALGHEVRVVPATLVRSLGVGYRGVKTDKRDAQVLSEVSCRVDLPSVHIPEQQTREYKSMCGMRDQLIAARTQLINCVRGYLRANSIRPRTGSTETFAERVRKTVTPPDFVERLLVMIETLCKQITAADKQLNDIVKANSLLSRLMTCPGVGPVTALRFVTALDDVTRFANAHQVESYLGLTPGERQSSDKQHRTGITKAGATSTRRCLIQAAWAARRLRSIHPMVAWSHQVERRRGTFVAVTALARKLAGILFAMWRDGTAYDKSRGAIAIE